MNSFEEDIRLKALAKKQKAALDEKSDRFFCALSEVVKTREGRVVLKTLLDMFPVDLESFSSDPYLTAFREGQRSAGVQMRRCIKEVGLNVLRKIEEETL